MELNKGEDVRELHETYFDGIRKTMYWLAGTDHVFITVEDEKTGKNFSLDVPPGQNPLQWHQHAYARSPYYQERGNLYASPEGE